MSDDESNISKSENSSNDISDESEGSEGDKKCFNKLPSIYSLKSYEGEDKDKDKG